MFDFLALCFLVWIVSSLIGHYSSKPTQSYQSSSYFRRFPERPKSKLCKKCQLEFPNTKQYFALDKINRVRNICLSCHSPVKKKSQNKVQTTEESKFRTCRACNKSFPLNKQNFGHTPKGNFRNNCRACMRGTVQKHSEENPDMVKARLNKRKSTVENMKDLKDYVENDLRNILFNSQGKKCFYCKQDLNINKSELDHMNPISQGGADIKENIVLACVQCNKEKHDKDINKYRAWKKRNGEQALF